MVGWGGGGGGGGNTGQAAGGRGLWRPVTAHLCFLMEIVQKDFGERLKATKVHV